MVFFIFKQKTAYEMRISDWSSDVCSSDLVRAKLDACRAADDSEARYGPNIAALERVLPRQLEPVEITARLGAPWIPGVDVEEFCQEVLDATVDIEHLGQLGHWSARLREGSRRGVALSSEWGTARADAITLLDASLNQRLDRKSTRLNSRH